MLSGSLNSLAGALGMYGTITGLPVIGGLIGGLLPASGSLNTLSGSAEPIGSVADLLSTAGS